MGCGGSKPKAGGAHKHPKAPHQAAVNLRYPLLDTPEEQSLRFLQICAASAPSIQQQQQQHQQLHGSSSKRATATPAPLSPSPNPLALELKRVYDETRARVFAQQLGDGEALATQHDKERQERLQRVHGRHLLQTNAVTTERQSRGEAVRQGEEPAKDVADRPQSRSAVLPVALQNPAQREFSLYVNDSVAQAQRRGFTAFSVVEAVELFVGYVKHDLQVQQEQARRENTSRPGSRRGSLDTRAHQAMASGATPSVPWTCRMQCTLSGDTAVAEKLLDDARYRWRKEREASHVKPTASSVSRQASAEDQKNRKRAAIEAKRASASSTRNLSRGKGDGGKAKAVATSASEPLQDSSLLDDNVEGGKGMLFIDAVFESALPGSFDRRTPWQLEIILYFTA